MSNFRHAVLMRQGLALFGVVVLAGLASEVILNVYDDARISLIQLTRYISSSLSEYGLRVEFYKNPDFTEIIAERSEPEVLRNYAELPPPYPVKSGALIARWSGWLLCPDPGKYSFFGQSIGALRLTIDGHTVLENWKQNEWFTSGTHGQINLQAGRYPVMVEHFSESAERAAIRIRWTGPGIPPNTVLSAPYLLKGP